MFTALKQRFNIWLFRPKIEHGTVVLTQRRIFILPTRQGLAFCLLLILMLLGDINYSLSLGYVLTFLLAMMAVLSMLHAFQNLAGLQIRTGRTDAVFCGNTAYFQYYFNSTRPCYQLCLRNVHDARICFDVPPHQEFEVAFPLPATKRGWLTAGRLTLYTEFPLGLFHAWSHLHFDTRILVYPAPVNDASLPTAKAPDGVGKSTMAGDDDFAGLRNYIAGDALPRIAWKAYARGHTLQVKQFSTPLGEELWLDMADTPEHALEEKLSRMTRWVLEAHRRKLQYGLRLPGSELAADNSMAHRDECLRRLALFGLDQS